MISVQNTPRMRHISHLKKVEIMISNPKFCIFSLKNLGFEIMIPNRMSKFRFKIMTSYSFARKELKNF